ncbi:MAG: transaldolase [Dehalococcoidia bacterium]|nr:transaldolase [Dehalococcoidia bacterium]
MKLKVKLFADGAEKAGMLEMYQNPLISGFTTNPTLMKIAGVSDYEAFAKDILTQIPDKPISFEVFSDEFDEMERQALDITSWGENVYVKIPITNTKGESSVPLVATLSGNGVKVNVTAMFTVEQVQSVIPGLSKGPGSYVSVFAGRIADAGLDPLPIMREVLGLIKDYPGIELIWASPRELYNVVQANDIGCDIITATNSILKKLPSLGKDLNQFSLETVQMFYDDASEAGYTL